MKAILLILVPILLAAERMVADEILLGWKNPNAQPVQFRVYSSADLSSKLPWTRIATTDQTSTRIEVKSLDSYFYVTSYDSKKQEESKPSNIIRGRNIVSQKAISTRISKARLTIR